MDTIGKSDPYLKLELLDAAGNHNHTIRSVDPLTFAPACMHSRILIVIGTVLATKTSPTVDDSLTPVWNYIADFNDVIATATSASRVKVNVWDKDIGKDEFM